MDERPQGRAQLRRALPTARARRAGLLRFARSGHTRTTGSSRARARDLRLLLLLLLVQRQAASRTAARRSIRIGQTRLSVLRVLGQRELDPAVGWARGGCTDRAELF